MSKPAHRIESSSDSKRNGVQKAVPVSGSSRKNGRKDNKMESTSLASRKDTKTNTPTGSKQNSNPRKETANSLHSKTLKSTDTVTMKPLCDVCSGKNKKEVDGFCCECKFYLCQKCSNSHKTGKKRGHTILRDNAIPKPSLGQPVTEAYCVEHDQNLLKYFCFKHEEACCSTCKKLTHTRCGELVPLTEVLAEAWKSPQCKNTVEGMKKLLFQFMRVKYTRNIELWDIEKQKSETLHNVEAERLRINALLDKLMATMKFQLEKVYEKRMETKKNQINAADEIIHKVRGQLDLLDDGMVSKVNTKVFVEMAKAKKCLQKYQQTLNDFKVQSSPELLEFSLDRGIDEITSNLKKFSELRIKVPGSRPVTWRPFVDRNVTPTGDANIHLDTDGRTCDIPAVKLLSNGNLLLTDLANLKVKLFDSEFRNLSQIRLDSKPFDGIDVSSTELAVTIPNRKQILFLTYKHQMKTGRSIPTDTQCLGIVHHEGRLIVGCQNPAQLQIIDLSGIVLKTIRYDMTTGDEIFLWPNYLSLSTEKAMFYVSDPKAECVFGVTVGGTVLMKYGHKSLKGPTAVTQDSLGNLFIIGSNSNNMRMVSFDGLEDKMVKFPSLARPQGLCFIPYNTKLVVSANQSNTVYTLELQ